MQIKALRAPNIGRVEAFYKDAPDYWIMAEGVAPGRAKAEAFFTDCPPGCDPAASLRWGVFLQQRLPGLVEISFGFPDSDDAYLGF